VRGGAVLAKGFDPECADVALEGVCALGVDARLETQVREVRGEPGLLTVVVFDRGGREHGLQVERVLAATGRKAALEALDLETGGVAVGGDERPLVDSHLRSVSNPRVWVAGDASGGIQLTPVAGYQGSRVAESIMSGRPQVSDTSGIPSTCFTQPEIARVGELESELIARGAPYKVAHGAFSGTAQGIIDGGRRSLVKLLFDADDRLAGAHLAGPEAGEHIYGLSVALQADATLTDLQSARAIHPTLAEGIYWAASNAERVEGERTQG
jgi:glutathione reductase (NADPH)